MEFAGLGDGFLLPSGDELESRLEDRGTRIEPELPGDDFDCLSTFHLLATDFLLGLLYRIPHRRTAVHRAEHRSQWDRSAIFGILGNSPHRRAKLAWVHIELGQCHDTEDTGIVSDRGHGPQAGKQITHLASIRNIHALDGKREISIRKFTDHVVAMHVRAIENAEVAPLATQFSPQLTDDADHIRSLSLFARK